MRCFIIGNGPSLNETDLKKLKHEITFGCNRIYLKYEEMGFGVTNYFEIDSLEAFQLKEEINDYIQNIDIENVFTLKRFENYFKAKKLHIVDTESIPFKYSNTGVVMCWEAIQMGYNPIYIIGIDLDYSDLKENIISIGNNIYKLKDNIEDSYHFNNNYWKGKDDKFIFFDEEERYMIEAFEELKKYVEKRDIKIYNAGIKGKANMFERIDYNSLF